MFVINIRPPNYWYCSSSFNVNIPGAGSINGTQLSLFMLLVKLGVAKNNTLAGHIRIIW